jgi:hypothetical protein
LKMVDWTKRKNRNKIVCDNVVTAIKERILRDMCQYQLLLASRK